MFGFDLASLPMSEPEPEKDRHRGIGQKRLPNGGAATVKANARYAVDHGPGLDGDHPTGQLTLIRGREDES